MDVPRATVFMLAMVAPLGLGGSCGGAPPPPPPPPGPPPIARYVPHHPVDASVPDAAAPLLPGLRGDACGPARACDDGLTCRAELPGGACASACEPGTLACGPGAACAETPRAGAICLRACGSDAECRVEEGYVCDPAWHVCAVPGFTARAPRQCPAPPGRRHDAAFGPDAALDAAGALAVRSPAAIVADDGTLVSLVIAGDGGRGALRALHGEAAVTLADAADEPALARAGAAAIAAWRSAADARPALRLAVTRDRGATWSPPAEIALGADCEAADARCPERPRLAASAHALYLAYSSDALGTRIRSSRDSGATWSEAVTALTGARGDVAVAGDGRLHVIAMAGGSGGAYGAAQHAIEYAASSDGGRTFTRAVTLSARDELVPATFANPTLALDERRGWIYAGYVRGGSGAWAIVVAASKDKGKTWARTTVAEDACALALVPSLAVDGASGALHVAWYDARGGAGDRFAHAACGPGATRCRDLGAIETTPMAALGTGRHDARWLGDAEALVIDDRRHVLHALWTAPEAQGDAIATRVRHASAKLPTR